MLLWFAVLALVLVAQVFDSPNLDYRLVVLGAVLPVAEGVLGGPWLLHTLPFCGAVVFLVDDEFEFSVDDRPGASIIGFADLRMMEIGEVACSLTAQKLDQRGGALLTFRFDPGGEFHSPQASRIVLPEMKRTFTFGLRAVQNRSEVDAIEWTVGQREAGETAERGQ